MTYTPVVPLGGYAGWTFLKRTLDQQQKAFTAQASVQRDDAYFREKIGGITTAEQLVNDPRLLRISLAAFGLDANVGNKFFIRKILEDGTLKPDALANRLANKQYTKFTTAFGFGDFTTPRTKLSDFADKILLRYKDQQFAKAVGSQNEDMRLALNAERELPDLISSSASPLSKWYSVLGNAPLRLVFERAFGLPRSFGAIDIDKQVETFQAKSQSLFGSRDLQALATPENMTKLVRLFLVRSEIETAATSWGPAQVALTLLQRQQ